jgi:hypothetical protein
MMIPKIFLWSRIGPEGGFDLSQILYWKEMQRRLCGDTFWWGIGTPPAATKIEAVLKQRHPKVLFSVQKTQKHRERRSRILWTRYINENGIEKPLGKYVLITSESIPSRAQFAIHASSSNPIGLINGIGFDAGLYRHINGKSNLGQTVTAVLEKNSDGAKTGPLYDQGFSAELIDVRKLAGPVELKAPVVKILDQLASERPLLAEFKRTIAKIRAEIR